VPEREKRLSADELAYIQSDRDESHAEGAGKVPWLSLFKYRQAWSIIVARFMTDPVWWFFLIWLPDYFKKTRNLDISHSWVHLAAIYAIITAFQFIRGFRMIARFRLTFFVVEVLVDPPPVWVNGFSLLWRV
jgi:ACS family hexuronate transporter-like MFS transporter